MSWTLVAWTAAGWLISGGLLYATYRFGRDAGQGEGDWKAWKNGLLALILVFAAVIFGTGSGADDAASLNHEESLTPADWSRMVGILIAFVSAYAAGFWDGRSEKRRRERT